MACVQKQLEQTVLGYHDVCIVSLEIDQLFSSYQLTMTNYHIKHFQINLFPIMLLTFVHTHKNNYQVLKS
jgi:hypothetical protein